MQVESFEDAAQARLEQIYRELAARNADARESVARRILLGLGQPKLPANSLRPHTLVVA